MIHTSSYLDVIEDQRHNLLEPPSLEYSSVTVRRAFVVWMCCGQKNSFKEVCNYFHYLEALEEKLSEESRASSRLLEFNLFTNPPPTSAYLTAHFPTLYAGSTQFQQHLGEAKSQRQQSSDLKLQEMTKLEQACGTSKAEILKASAMIRDYCKSNGKTLDRFLKEFKDHTETCRLNNTVGNVVLYIKRKLIQAEIQLGANYTVSLELLEEIHKTKCGVNETIIGNQTHSGTDRSNPVILEEGTSLHTVSRALFKDKTILNRNINEPKFSDADAGEGFANNFKNCNGNNVDIKLNSLMNVSNESYNSIQRDRTGGIKFSRSKFSDSDFIFREDIVNLRNM